MSINANAGYVLETTAEHRRNPYVVLNIVPVFENDLWDTLKDLAGKAVAMQEILKNKNALSFKNMPEDDRLRAWKSKLAKATGQAEEVKDDAAQTEPDFDHLWRALLEKMGETGEKNAAGTPPMENAPAASTDGKKKGDHTTAGETLEELELRFKKTVDSQENLRDKRVLPVLIEHYQHFLAAKLEGERIDALERSLFAVCEKHLALLPPEAAATVGPMPRERRKSPLEFAQDDGKFTMTTVVVIPQIADIREWAVRLQTALAALPKTPKPRGRGKKKSAGEEQTSPADDVAAKLSTQAELADAHGALGIYENIRLQAMQIADDLLHVADEIQRRYTTLARDFHPDRNPGDQLKAEEFKEANHACGQLLNASQGQREQWARDMVFGQNTAAWTPDMRTLTDPITKMLAAVFALQRGGTIDPETQQRCTSCVDGVVLMQQATDYIPVPLKCSVCNGTGAVQQTLLESRAAVEKTITKKKRK